MSKAKRLPPPGKSAVGAAKPPTDPGRLPLTKRVVFSLIALVLGLALIEVVLALCGVRPDSYERDPYVGFTAQTPLFVEERDASGRVFLVTARNKLPFFNAQRFPQRKEPGVFRVFVLGGSTAYGHPFHDATSFSGWLREYLGATVPNQRWEVVNTGGISYGSYRDARLMEELIGYQPDLFVLYESQNEFLERRIYRQITETPAALRRIANLAAYSRAATVVKRGIEKLQHAAADRAGTHFLLKNEPDTVLEHPEGMAAYTRDEAATQQILNHFRFNLGRMAEMARSTGARVIFIAPASNLREVTPFKSEFRADLSDADRRRWKDLFDEARRAAGAPAPTNALTLLAQAAAIDELPAGLHFLTRIFHS